MNILDAWNKPITKFWITLVLFLFTTLLFSTPIQSSIEDILLSRAKVHSQSYDLALSPLPEEKSQDNVDRYSLINASSEYKGENISTGFRDRGIVASDARATALRQFLIDYNSPIAPYANVFVQEADEYGLDWRLAAAISGVESGFGVIPVRANNAWGWKGGPGGDFNAFDSWEHGIEVVTRRLALGYGIHMTPFEIEPIYCPPCARNPAHLWANGVVKFMNQIDMYLYGF